MTHDLCANSLVIWEDWGSKTAPAGNRGLAHPKPLSLSEGRTAMVPTAPLSRITVPRIRSRRCWDTSPNGRPCSRAAGHAGRHLFAWIHLDGRVREVWQ